MGLAYLYETIKKSLNIPKRTLSRTTLGSYEAHVLHNVRISRVESVMSLRAGKMVSNVMNEKSAWDEEKILMVLQTTEFSLVSGRASLRGIQKSEARLFIKTQIVLFFLFFNFWRTQNSSCLLLYLWHTDITQETSTYQTLTNCKFIVVSWQRPHASFSAERTDDNDDL